MEIIKPLSEDVHSMVRSGFIIDCLSTVVEELIYNSLDAGAKKVAVTVAVNNGYVKVEDDGFGITRSGLVLLGERYATSKQQNSHEKHDVRGSFGFRGEVLCSIADVSLVEIITRVQGRPNGYRKVMKGRKCLCLSVDNDRLAVGTTVIVRDLFYNQPVRRRQMQCSAKKVLHSVKKSAVQIALVQPKVSFKVIDKESEDELLSTRCCPSPLTLLCSNFGIEASSLHELSFSEGLLQLKGYVSALSSSFSSKAVQYIYVNSRFVDKGPIHKVLNRLADMCLDQLRGGSGVKKSQPQGPSYCLNLACPRYSYDLNLEFSRASVEFKDWASVLAFIEKSVMSLWREEIKRGSFHNHEADQIRQGGKENVVEEDMWLKSCEMSTKRRKTQKSENQRVCTKGALELQVEDCKSFSLWKNTSRQSMNSETISVNFGKSKLKESLHQMGITGTSYASHTNCIYDAKDGIDSQLLEPQRRLVFEDFLRNGITSMETEATNANDCFPSSRLKEEESIDYPYGGCHEVGNVWSFNLMPKNNSNSVNEDQELLLQGTSWENPIETPLDFVKESQFPIYNFNSERSISNFHGNRDADSLSQNSAIIQRAQCESEAANSWPLPESGIESRTRNHVDTCHLGYDKSLSSCGGSFDGEYPLEFTNKRDKVLLPCSSTNFHQQTAATCPILELKDWDIENLIENEGSERRLGVRNCDGIEQFYYDRDDFYHSGLDDRRSNRNLFSTRRLNTKTLFTTEHAGVEKSMWELSPPGHNVDETASIRSESFQDINSPSTDRRRKDSTFFWSPLTSSDKGIEMDLQGCPELKLENILIENTKRIYDSPDGLLTNRCDSMVGNETFSPNLDLQIKSSPFKPSVYCSSAVSAGKGPNCDLPRCQVFEPHHKSSESKCSLRSRRSHSAPPFYRGKKRFLSVSSSLTTTTENSALQTASQVSTVSEKMQSKNPPKMALPRRVNPQDDEIRFGENSLFCLEQKVKEISNITPVGSRSHDGNREAACFSSGYLMEVQDTENLQTKWRDGCPDVSLKDISKCLTTGVRLNDRKDENEILDIQSCMLDLAGDSLVPKSINRSGLQNAKVLWQIDNKYIPVVAGGTLAVIDQHAADERIRLEEMRQKVLSNEMKSIHYLEKEKDLVLPEMSYQLLCNYAEHIKHWGWICNIFSQDSGSFAKNLNLLNERESNLTLVAVPCILGVNLSDADLVEFLEQLADTDGSSTIPPSVVRILNYKACRGAIMFGDKLLPSECSLIVEELKKTSLCFQCAHGRPTTVPLVNLKALHKAILHLGLWRDRSNDAWHGHCRKKITLDRAKHRLDVARGCG